MDTPPLQDADRQIGRRDYLFCKEVARRLDRQVAISRRGWWRGTAAHWLLIATLDIMFVSAPAHAQDVRFAAGNRTRGLVGGWGHSWRFGVPGYGKTKSDVEVVAFHPQMGWFLTDRLELYGEATAFFYYRPTHDVTLGLTGLAGRYHFRNDRAWTPYVAAGAGLLWTSLNVPELDRIFNFQLLYGLGIRVVPRRGPGWTVELRNHHLSNAGTAGANLGLNAAAVVAGVQWILR
jgi:hypothetical protein